MKTYYIHTMGCRANQFEGSIIEENLQKNGLKKVSTIEQADIYILNSCSVTHKSDKEAFYLLRNAKNKNPNIKTVITGCIAQIEKEKLLNENFIDEVIGNDEKLHIYDYLKSNTNSHVSDLMIKNKFSEIEISDTTKTRASIKVQDGCDNRCAYCIIWKARGKSRSAGLEYIIKQINNLSDKGFKEVMITGIHIGQWGKDLNMNFLDLIKAIEEKTKIERFRLGSLNPTEINDELLEYLRRSNKFCPHFHLSLQSACDKTLKSMNRFYSTKTYLEQINKINEIFDLPFIGSDIIAGFAGETEKDFDVTCDNLNNSGLTQIHTFPYSIREGTQGESMPNQVSEDEKERRSSIIKEISRKKYQYFINKNIGKIHEVLIEKHRDKHTQNLKGLTRNYLSVQIKSGRQDLHNTIQNVKIIKYENNVIYAQLINES